MNLLKKISIIPLLLLAAMPLLYSVFFLIQQSRIRYAMLEKLEEEHLQVITLAKADFSWIKEGKEIKTGEDLFDVKEWKEVNGKIVLKGIYDKKEKQLHAALIKLTNGSGQNSASQNNFAKVFTQFTGISNYLSWQLFPVSVVLINRFASYKENISEITIPVFTPPPQV